MTHRWRKPDSNSESRSEKAFHAEPMVCTTLRWRKPDSNHRSRCRHPAFSWLRFEVRAEFSVGWESSGGGMSRSSNLDLVTRFRRFESRFLQRRVCLSPESAVVGQEPRLSARVCAAGLASGSAETRVACRSRANRPQYLCRAIFQYRNAADGVGENAMLVPTKSEPSPGLTVR